MKIGFALILGMVLASGSHSAAEDEKIREKVYLSKENQIIRIGTPMIGNVRYLVVNFKNRLDGRNSKGRAPEEKSNFGDSASTYCYRKESELSGMEQSLLVEWFKSGGTLNVVYSCGEALEEEKRKGFPGFAETNCQCLDFIFKHGNASRGMWR